jgi:hypothetical protein
MVIIQESFLLTAASSNSTRYYWPKRSRKSMHVGVIEPPCRFFIRRFLFGQSPGWRADPFRAGDARRKPANPSWGQFAFRSKSRKLAFSDGQGYAEVHAGQDSCFFPGISQVVPGFLNRRSQVRILPGVVETEVRSQRSGVRGQESGVREQSKLTINSDF